MQIDRLFMITYYLLNHRSTTAKELSEQFEVSARTILRDIEILSSAGIPIYTAQGTGGGIFLDKDYVLNKTALTDEEQQKIILALKSISATGQVDIDALTDRLNNLFAKQYCKRPTLVPTGKTLAHIKSERGISKRVKRSEQTN